MQHKSIKNYFTKNFLSILLLTGVSLSFNASAIDQATKNKVIAASKTSKAEKAQSQGKILALSSNDNIPVSHFALQQLGEQSSAFSVDINSKIDNLNLKDLKKYDAVFLSQKIVDSIFKNNNS